MTNFTTNTYTLKREILNFSNKVSQCLSKPDRKFTADITYGMLASGSCLLTDVADQLHEDSKKINSVSANGLPMSRWFIWMTVMSSNRMATNSKLWALFGMDPKALVRKMSMKKAIM